MTTKTRLTIIGLVAVVAIIGAAVIFAPGGSESAAESPSANAAPEVEFVYFDGSPGTFADFRGQPLVVNFWASWCPACVAEMTDFEAVHQELGDEVAFLGLDMQDVSREAALALIEQTGVSYTLADDPSGSIYQQFNGFAMPTTIFIDADGNVVGRQNGTIFADDLKDTINELLLNG